MMPTTTSVPMAAPRASGWCCRFVRSLALVALLSALGLPGCANRVQLGAGTALAVEAMAVAAEQRRAAGGPAVPVGPFAVHVKERLETGAGDSDGEGGDETQ